MEGWISGLSALVQATHFLACPAHCHPSIVAPFLLGLLSGVCLSLVVLAGLAFVFFLHPHLLRAPASFTPQPYRTTSRLRGYLHEH